MIVATANPIYSNKESDVLNRHLKRSFGNEGNIPLLGRQWLSSMKQGKGTWAKKCTATASLLGPTRLYNGKI